MPELWQATHRYDSSWSSLVLAFALRYPSPVTPHIATVDVISRRVDLETQSVETERLILKRGASSALPKWFPKQVLGKTESWIYERSLVDIHNRQVQCITRNLDHRNLMDIHEDLLICEDSDGTGGYPDSNDDDLDEDDETVSPAYRRPPPRMSQDRSTGSRIDTTSVVTSSFGMAFLRSRIELFGHNRYRAGIVRSRQHLHTILELLRDSRLRQSMLAGHPPPLSALLAPALGESFARWEETAAGFAGHGFTDVQEDRFGFVTEHHSETPLPPRKTIPEWISETRQVAVEKAAERFKSVRSAWFGWRLQYRQVDKDQSQSKNGTSGEGGKPDDGNSPPKAKTWVWEWSKRQ